MGTRGQRVAVVLLVVVFVVVVVVLVTQRGGEGPAVATATPGTALNPTASPGAAAYRPGVRTKTTGCRVRGPLPDPACSPGALLTSDVRAICTAGYSQSVREVPVSEKNAVYAEYGITSHKTGQYEVDHIISLQLGGSNDLANLFPEAAEPRPGFHEKDKVENELHRQVCAGKLSLADAQRQIATDWVTVYRSMPASSGGSSADEGNP
jgi:hypothetical protein